MPNLPLRPCSKPGCVALGAGGLCASHRQQRQQRDDDQRGTPQQRGYDADHLRMRILCFERDGWRCVRCGWEPKIVTDYRGYGLGIPPTVRVVAYLRACFNRGERHLHADHKVKIDVAPELRLDLDNMQTLCDACHRAKTMSEIKAAGVSPDGRHVRATQQPRRTAAPRCRRRNVGETCANGRPMTKRRRNVKRAAVIGGRPVEKRKLAPSLPRAHAPSQIREIGNRRGKGVRDRFSGRGRAVNTPQTLPERPFASNPKAG
jgi:5-methylcytosine-specific restriction protein A